MQIMSSSSVIGDLYRFFRFWPLAFFLLMVGSSMCIGRCYQLGPVESAHEQQEREEIQEMMNDFP